MGRVVDQDTLTCLDAIQWLRTTEEAANRFKFSMSTISRQTKKCLDIFRLELKRTNGELNTIGDTKLLFMERRIHQKARWMGSRPLRLEATYWSGPLLCTPTPERWLMGPCNIVGIRRNFQLIRERIVDACITGLPDIPSPDDTELTALALSSMPVFFVANPSHPLTKKPKLTFNDIAMYPTLALPTGEYPIVEKSLREIGLWNDPIRMARYKRELWEGKTEADLTIGYATVLSMKISGENLVRLPLHLPFTSGEAIVLRREFLVHQETFRLRELIQKRLFNLAKDNVEIKMLNN
jgi:hypothetical protein